MGINEVHDYIQFFLKKENGGYVSHEEIDKALDMASMNKFTELFGNVKQYQPGRPVPSVSYGISIRIHEDLRKFKMKSVLGTGATANGVVALPSDYFHIVNLILTYSDAANGQQYAPVKIINENELAQRLDSQILKPTQERPICVIGATSIQVYPSVAFAGEFSYLKRPAKPKYNYTVSGRQQIFNPTGSQDLEWPDDCTADIINKALVILGARVNDDTVVAISQAKDQAGA
jgi:hypothetical protein